MFFNFKGRFCIKKGGVDMGGKLKGFCSIIVVIAFVLGQTGCSCFAPTRQSLAVTTSEADAEIFVNGNLIGKGAATTEVSVNKDAAIMVKKDGYYPATQTIPVQLSMTGVLDIIGGVIFLIPFIGLMTPGAFKLQTSSVNMALAKT